MWHVVGGEASHRWFPQQFIHRDHSHHPSHRSFCLNASSFALSLLKISVFTSLSDLVEDKMPVCLSVSVSCLLPSSSSHCVVSTSEKRGTKKEKSLPLLSQKLSRPLPILVPCVLPSAPFVCPPAWLRPPLGLWSSSHHTSQVIPVWLLPAGRWALCPRHA